MRSLVLVWLVCALVACCSANNITAYQSKVNDIFELAMQDNVGYERLSYLCNRFGPRITGSTNLENAITWIVEEMKKDGFDSVTTEPVTVPTWVRNEGFLRMNLPYSKKLGVLALGGSIATPAEGITAPILVVKDFDELKSRASEAKGKIVVYNAPFTTYSGTVQYRSRGAVEAAKVGAVASLTRSITPYSLYTPHTGNMNYDSSVPRIPAAAITIEDAVQFQYLQDHGIATQLTLFLNCENRLSSPSHNVIAELKGSELPHELVVIGGHIDSWDVGTGAQDDGGGIMQTWSALRLLAAANLRPRRTIRVVMWTSEENGGAGADTYFDNHLSELGNTTFCYESDDGTFVPVELRFKGKQTAMYQVREIANLMTRYVHLNVAYGDPGADVEELAAAGVPGVGLEVAGDNGADKDRYFWYHHTNADTMEHVDPHELQLCTGTTAALAYVVADMQSNLPRI